MMGQDADAGIKRSRLMGVESWWMTGQEGDAGNGKVVDDGHGGEWKGCG